MGCIAAHCGVEALECLTGLGDPLCHKAVTCVPEKLLGCSTKGFGCVFSHDSICRENLACVSKGASVCADPVVNLGTDRNISQVMYCANEKCPAPTEPKVHVEQ